MQLDYKDIIIKHYALSMSGSEIARQTGFSKSGVNDFLRAFKKCEDLSYKSIFFLYHKIFFKFNCNCIVSILIFDL